LLSVTDTKTRQLLHKIDRTFNYCHFGVEISGNVSTTLETFCKTRKQMASAFCKRHRLGEQGKKEYTGVSVYKYKIFN